MTTFSTSQRCPPPAVSSGPRDRPIEELERENAELRQKLEEALGRIKQLEQRLIVNRDPRLDQRPASA